MNTEDRQNLVNNIVGSMKGITDLKKMKSSTDSYVIFSEPILSLA
jgi:hypothetical protein